MGAGKRTELQQQVVEALLDSKAIDLEAVSTVFSKFGDAAARNGDSLVNIIDYRFHLGLRSRPPVGQDPARLRPSGLRAGPDRGSPVPPGSPRSAQRSRADLAARVIQALSFASLAVQLGVPGSPSAPVAPSESSRPGLVLPAAKVQAEATMLLRCSAIAAAAHPLIGEAARQLTAELLNVQDETLLSALCLEPGRALDHAFVHIQLRTAGPRRRDPRSSVARRPDLRAGRSGTPASSRAGAALATKHPAG